MNRPFVTVGLMFAGGATYSGTHFLNVQSDILLVRAKSQEDVATHRAKSQEDVVTHRTKSEIDVATHRAKSDIDIAKNRAQIRKWFL